MAQSDSPQADSSPASSSEDYSGPVSYTHLDVYKRQLPLHLVIGTIADLLQLRDEPGPVDEKSAAGLIPAKAAYQVYGAAAAQTEQALADGTVHYRHIQHGQFRQDLGDTKQPLRFSGHAAGLSALPAIFLPALPAGVQQHVMDLHPKAIGLGAEHLAQQQLPIPFQAHRGAAFHR